VDSLAILLHQLIPDINNGSILILATDINQDSLARAKQSLYSDWSFRENRAKATRSLYFTPRPNVTGCATISGRWFMARPG